MKSERPTFKEACKGYPHRFTMDHVPAWAKRKASNGKYYAPQYKSDGEWYAKTFFPGEPECLTCFSDGAAGSHCTSTKPSWPLGQWLDEPYTGRA